jgi:Dockerin type I domain
MARYPRGRSRPRLEPLETRLPLSISPSANTFGLSPPANAIDVSLGDLTRPDAIATTSVTLAPQNITPHKHATTFAVFVAPTATSGLAPRTVAVKEGGRALPLQFGRPYQRQEAGQATDQAVAFFKADHARAVSILVAGQAHTTGSYTVLTTLPGDVNGDGQVNLADLAPFAKAYGSSSGDPDYNPAADSNRNGYINLFDAKALEYNMTPVAPDGPLNAIINLAPTDQVHYPAPKNSGGATLKKHVEIVGATMPGSIVIEIRLSNLTTPHMAIATNAKGFFNVSTTNSQGVNTTNFLIIDPYGCQLVRSYPIFWIPFAAPHSKYQPPTTA